MSTLTASHGLTLSSTGLKLIKAYEGYRPVDRTLVTGQRVVGYGHRLFDDAPAQLSKDEAENLLKTDLQAFEDMINESVHAPLSQGQFDALVSFAFNIGPKAFLASDTLRALNNGRPLDAANGLDAWRKSTINGQTYVVDALMRRRTAEKALFLSLDKKPRPASGVDLPPVKDEHVAALETEDDLPIFTNDPAAGVVAHAPYDAERTPSRRREDGPAGILMLSEIVEDSDTVEEPKDDPDAPWTEHSDEFLSPDGISDDQEREALTSNRSVIAEAAADISDRLDALIDKARDEDLSDTQGWPESLIQGQKSEEVYPADDLSSEYRNEDNLVAFPNKPREEEREEMSEKEKSVRRVPSKAEIEAAVFEASKEGEGTLENSDIDSSQGERAVPLKSDSASRYIERHAPPDADTDGQSNLGFWVIMLTGFVLLGASLAAYFRGTEGILGEYGPLLILSGLLIGSVMVLGAIYYAVRRSIQ
mgnify:CR=1 FL=1|jgi:GH24 family phage-related lysozyme (muramidase)